MIDNNAFCLKRVNLELYRALRKKPTIFLILQNETYSTYILNQHLEGGKRVFALTSIF